MPKHTSDDMLAALCIWEYALEKEHVMDWLRGQEGHWAAREQAMRLAHLIDEAYDFAVEKEYQEDFDWTFVPHVMEMLVKQYTRPRSVTQELLQPRKLGHAVAEEFRKAEAKRRAEQSLDEKYSAVRAELVEALEKQRDAFDEKDRATANYYGKKAAALIDGLPDEFFE